MIVTDKVWVQKNAKTYEYYTSIGYEFFKVDFSRYSHTLVKVQDLHEKSRANILCKCVQCGKERTLEFYQYREICHECSNKKPVSKDTKEKQSKAKTGKQLGELNPSWKGGKPICECGTILSNWKGTQCKSCFLKRDQTGENNPTWKNYTEAERLQAISERKGYLNRRWVTTIKNIFKNTCDTCGKEGDGFHAHHLANWKDNVELRFNEDNGVLLCPSCHMKFHSAYGKSNNTPEQYYKFKEAYNG